MPGTGHGAAQELLEYTDPVAAIARVREIYNRSIATIRDAFARFSTDQTGPPLVEAHYPYLGIEVMPADLQIDSRPAYGTAPGPGIYGTTLTRPDLFGDYYIEQVGLLLQYHGGPVSVGVSRRPIALPFVVEHANADVTAEGVRRMHSMFTMPQLEHINDAVANGTYTAPHGTPFPLALFSADRIDLGIHRLQHYTATKAKHFQRFVLFTNYQRYVDQFISHAKAEVTNGDEYVRFVEPGEVITANSRLTQKPSTGEVPSHLPQMPAYHLVREDHLGITLINIGIGPSNAKTITDHLAVLRPHCWLMIGHCGGLRRSQMLGDYVLAHAYVREDNVMNDDLPPWVPVPPIAEIQVALQEAVATVTGLHGSDLKTRMRTGTVASTDNRNWELHFAELSKRFNQSRAIAIDMESATIAANGFRLRVPYGTLLCVSDKPMHGEIKLRGMANAFYQERISQHLKIGLETVRILREGGVQQLHSRKLRSLHEPPFR